MFYEFGLRSVLTDLSEAVLEENIHDLGLFRSHPKIKKYLLHRRQQLFHKPINLRWHNMYIDNVLFKLDKKKVENSGVLKLYVGILQIITADMTMRACDKKTRFIP